MNVKNLLLKFLFLAGVVTVLVLSLSFYGLKLGIDLRGGHSLVFEIRTYENEIRELDDRKVELTKKLDQARAQGDQKQINELQGQLTRLEADLKRFKGRREVGNLVDQMIVILKDRVDPNGLRSLEWRSSGNRIEIRMPAGSEKTREARRAYRKAEKLLAAQNVSRSSVRRVCDASGADRAGLIASLSAGNKDRADRLRDLGAAFDAEQKTRLDLRAARDAEEPQPALLKKLQGELFNRMAAYRVTYKAVMADNVGLQELQVVLANYVPDDEAKALKKKKDGKKELDERRKKFKETLAGMLEKHERSAGMINEVVEKYKVWSETRQKLEDPADLKRLIAKAGVLEFRIAPRSPVGGKESLISQADYEKCLDDLEKNGPEGLKRRNARWEWFGIRGDKDDFGGMIVSRYAGKQYILLFNQPGRTMLNESGRGGWQLKRAQRGMDNYQRLAVNFTLDAGGASRMGALTNKNLKKYMAIMLDDEAYSAPVIQSVITGGGQITGRFSAEDIDDLVRTLNAGSLPARLNPEPVAEQSFGPSLGRVNCEKGIRAAIIGLIAVAVFMLAYYLLAGAIADVALLLNVILVLGVMSLPPVAAVFTLPGIAGLILTIGIAVDANVLIFERLREEQAKGQSVALTIKNAYERAFSAIFDANLTTLITCATLAYFTTKEVRGFAITLGLGVVFSLFTSLVVTRWILQALLNGKLLKKQMFMLRIIRVPKIDWISKRHFFWGLSGVMIVLGVASLIWQGPAMLGIELSAGTQMQVTFRSDALIDGELLNDGVVRDTFVHGAAEKRAKDPKYAKLADTARVEEVEMPDRVNKFLQQCGFPPNTGRITQEQWENQTVAGKKLNKAFLAKIDADGDGVMTREELADRLPSWTYQISTTETDMKPIRQVAREKFGDALQRREAIRFKLVKGVSEPQLGLDLSGDGKTKVQPVAESRYRDELRDFAGGVVFVIDTTKPTTPTDVEQRLREMRYQPDFGGQLNETKVIGLKSAGEKGYTRFATFVLPSEKSILKAPQAWKGFAEEERELLAAAMAREEHMLATNFDARIAAEMKWRAVFAVLVSWLAIVLYLWFRFGSIQWGLAAVVCLIHDVIIVVGLVAISGWLHETFVGRMLGIASFKIDLAMIAAILTVIGYSVNDTIVVFDRIRENRGKLTAVTPQVINASINQTLPRTILTSFTTFMVVFVMYVWGGPGIHAFNYALLAGIIFGTYSSIAVASPLLLGFKKALVARTAAAATR